MFMKKMLIWLAVPLIAWLATGCTSSTSKPAGDIGQNTIKSTAATDTLIFQAALDGNLDQLKSMINGGISSNLADKENRTALMYAAYNGHTEMVTYLLEKGANVNMNDINGRTALMFAASGPFAETVAVLLEHGAEINRADFEEHYTALMYAASEGQAAVVKVLLEHQADPLLKDADGETALTFARNNSHPEVAELLVSLTESAR